VLVKASSWMVEPMAFFATRKAATDRRPGEAISSDLLKILLGQDHALGAVAHEKFHGKRWPAA